MTNPEKNNEPGIFGRVFGATSKFLTAVRVIALNLITLLILVVLVVGISRSLQQGGIGIPESGALRVAISGSLVDQRTYQEPSQILLNPDQPQETLVYDLVKAIDLAAEDQRITSMVLVLHKFGGTGMSKIDEVGSAIMRFRARGKTVVAVSDHYTQNQYLLASYADRILMNPMGILQLTGLSSYRTYMAEALDKLKVNFHVFRTGEHKSAMEPYILSGMSDASRQQAQNLLDGLWDSFKAGVIERRPVTEEQLENYTHRLNQILEQDGNSLAEVALENKLVDRLATRDELISELQELAGANDSGDFYQHINAAAYLQQRQLEEFPEDKPKIGYLVAKGTILDGTQPSGTIGGDTLAWQLKQARLNDDLSALVLRIDSPGGSAFASEIIRAELALYEQAGIPVVASMGSVAASGGYWIAMSADEVWATPNTITGSIGAFSAIPTVEESMAALGLYADGVDTTPLSGAFRIDRPLSDAAKSIFQSQLNHLYERFLNLVAGARDMDRSTLEPLAGGRVWTGSQALELGLVDKLGDQLDAIASAAELANVTDNYQLHRIEPELSFSEQLIKQILENTSLKLTDISIWSRLSRPLEQQLQPLESISQFFTDPQHLYLHCDLCLAP